MERILENKNIILTRAKNQSVKSVKMFEEIGATVICLPTIKITTVQNDEKLDRTIINIDKFNTLIFTSENAVKHFLLKIEELNVNFNPKAYFVICIGERTANYCVENNFRVDFQPAQYSFEDLLKELSSIELIGRKIFIPCSNLSNLKQYESIQDFGASVTSIPVYNNSVNDIESLTETIQSINETNIDLYVFTSPSTFNGFLKIMNIENPKEYFENKNIAVIGPVTKQSLNDMDISPNIIPHNFTMNYLIDEVVKFYKTENSFSN